MPYREAIVQAEPPRPSWWAHLRERWYAKRRAWDRLWDGTEYTPYPKDIDPLGRKFYRRCWAFGYYDVTVDYCSMPAHWQATFPPPRPIPEVWLW